MGESIASAPTGWRPARRSSWLAAPVLLVVLTAGCAAGQDWDRDPVARWINRHSLVLIGATGAVMLLSAEEETADAGERALDAAAGSAATSAVLKAMVDASRPREPTADDGFPSAHTAVAFGFARALTDWQPDARPAFYGFASAVGWARVEGGYHDVDQVLAGAALGLFVADRSLDSGGLLLHSSDRPGRCPLAGEADSGGGSRGLKWNLWSTVW